MTEPIGPEKMQQIMDQGLAATTDFARLIGKFYKELVAYGVPEAQAATITQAYTTAACGMLPR